LIKEKKKRRKSEKHPKISIANTFILRVDEELYWRTPSEWERFWTRLIKFLKLKKGGGNSGTKSNSVI
jgi:hypothetical protein